DSVYAASHRRRGRAGGGDFRAPGSGAFAGFDEECARVPFVASLWRAAAEFRAKIMNEAFKTHEVLNQSPPFAGVNLFTADCALMEAVSREGGGHAVRRLTDFRSRMGSADAFP